MVSVDRLFATCCDDERGARAIRLAVAQARWRQVAGESVARHTAVVAVDEGGVVTVGVPGEPWVARLERQRAHLEAGFGLLAGGARVRAIRFGVVPDEALRGRTASSATRMKSESVRRPLAECPPLTSAEAATVETLKRGEGADLAPLFESWMRHRRRRRRDEARKTGSSRQRS